MSVDGGRALVIATRSRHKLGELQQLLQLERARLMTLDEVGCVEEALEEAASFRGNAVAKARFYAECGRYGEIGGRATLADDSGLEVDALDGAPGVRSRRYAGERATDLQNNELLLAELESLPPERRTARYRCVLAFTDPVRRVAKGRPLVVTRSGVFEGRIALRPRGIGGFGYDPLFEPLDEPPGGRTVGQMSSEEKNRVSHRARAARQMGRYLRSVGY